MSKWFGRTYFLYMGTSVLLGFSGGIDSTMSARLLLEMGYRVVALTINTTGDEAMLNKAERVATELGIEWLSYDAQAIFEREIIDYFCSEYALGRTPAPCTRCNTHIKWKILLSEANRMGIEHIATGHYFRIEHHNNNYYIAKGSDVTKDQSYYLWGLSQEVLSRAITPMGSMIKSEVKRGFRDKSESMGICFLNGKPYADFLKARSVNYSNGDILNCNGEICGRHNGIIHYTIGQRRGEGIPEGGRVVDIRAAENSIIVGSKQELYKSKLHITNCNIVDERELLTASDITIKIRGLGINPELPVSIERFEDGYVITTSDKAFAPAKGQPLVLYRNNLVIGGGIVESFE